MSAPRRPMRAGAQTVSDAPAASEGLRGAERGAEILPGAEPFSAKGGPHGVLVVHGFTGSPQSLRGLAEAFAAAGFAVELPPLLRTLDKAAGLNHRELTVRSIWLPGRLR